MLHLRQLRLPADSPDSNADEGIRAWIRQKVDAFFAGIAERTAEVR